MPYTIEELDVELKVAGSIEARFLDEKLLSAFIRKAEEAKLTYTTLYAHGVRLGHRIIMPFDTNRIRRYVSKVCSANEFGVVTYIRPSRGYRRHMRRIKSGRM